MSVSSPAALVGIDACDEVMAQDWPSARIDRLIWPLSDEDRPNGPGQPPKPLWRP